MQTQTKTDIITEKRCQSVFSSETCGQTAHRNPCVSLSGDRGFTLIEVMVAIIVLSIGIFAVGKFQSTAIDGDFKADKLTRASSMAANEAERLLSLDIDHDDLKADKNPHYSDPSCSSPSFKKQFCVGWMVFDNVPLPAITSDTNGEQINLTQTKTIEIVVFDGGGGFNSTAKERVKIQTIKPRCL